ncbi:MAG: preprotein translocase subunit SecE [Cytophagaceae bacterium]|nr:MAG: preprotein translocase subunit SecE [Cytophagaceae bacterium]
MQQTQRVLTMGLAAITGIVGLVLTHFVAWVLPLLAIPDRPVLGINELPLSLLVGITLAAALLLAIVRLERPRNLVGEIAEELTRVSWPSREETSHATWVVLVAIAVCAVYFGLFDSAWLYVTDWVLGVSPAAVS